MSEHIISDNVLQVIPPAVIIALGALACGLATDDAPMRWVGLITMIAVAIYLSGGSR